MLTLDRENQQKGASRTSNGTVVASKRFQLHDATVDAIISNCLINLSGDKPKVIAEAARVLRHGAAVEIQETQENDGHNHRLQLESRHARRRYGDAL